MNTITTGRRTNRRRFIAGVATASTGLLAGCSGSDEDGTEATPAQDTQTTEDSIEEVAEAETTLEQVYSRIHELPVVDDDEFVFDISRARNDFDFEETGEMVDESIAATEDLDEVSEVDADEAERLYRAAKLGFLLFHQRFLFGEAIAASDLSDGEILDGNYEEAGGFLAGAREQFEILRANDEEIEAQLELVGNVDVSVEGYDPASIRDSQAVVAEILTWSIPAYEGLEHTIRGFVLLDEGNTALEAERYEAARQNFERATERFADGVDAFDRAHGRGRRHKYAATRVDEFRCRAPIYRDGYRELDPMFDELEVGNKEGAREIAREPYDKMERRLNQCG